MKVAIMQPYLFPYIGYFQLINAVDTFVFYDDADYIQRGWVNRNRMLIGNEPKYFTVPVCKASLGTPINEIIIKDFKAWKINFLKSIYMNYKKSKNFDFLYDLLDLFLKNNDFEKIDDLASSSVKFISEVLDIKVIFLNSSNLYIDTKLNREQKIEMILDKLKGNTILLPPGSKNLYESWQPNGFSKHTLALPSLSYNQRINGFVPNLSIIDVLMHNYVNEVVEMINSYKCI
jgi:hypothetical protein